MLSDLRSSIGHVAQDVHLVGAGLFGVRSLRRYPQVPGSVPAPWVDVTLRGDRSIQVRRIEGPVGSMPVLLLHGWTLTADTNFSGAYEAIATQHTVIAYDCLRHGRGLRDQPFSVTALADEAVDVLDALGITRAIVVGYSLGGLAAMELALRYPDRLAGMVVQAAALDYAILPRDRSVLRFMPLLRPLARTGLIDSVGWRYWTRTALRRPELAARWHWLEGELSQMAGVDTIGVLDSVFDQDFGPRLAACSHLPPTAYVLLTRDRMCRPSLQREAANALNATVISVDADHDLPLADPAAYSAATVAAVSAVSPARADRRTKRRSPAG